MKCPRCHGERWVPWVTHDWEGRVIREDRIPCPECGGHGEVSCCGDLGLFDPAHADDWPVNETPEQEASDEKEPPR